MQKEFNIDATTTPPPVHLLIDGDYITKATECVKSAKEQINICAYTWKWYENAPEKAIQKFNAAICAKILKGVQVRAIIEMTQQAGYLREYGIECKILPTKRVMHTKAIQIDEKFLIVGSHNLTDRANSENYEISTLVTDISSILLFKDYFNKVWENYAIR